MFNTITLEMSLKPFKKTDDEYIRNVCREVFEDWRPLLKNRDKISIMLWVADGSEILDYTGDIDKSFEWAYFIGNANKPLLGKDGPSYVNLHRWAQKYMENPPIMTYRILKKIIEYIKDEGKKHFPASEILVGETFDIGPEFAISDFKYKRHNEVCKGNCCDNFGFVDCTALLNGDDYPYAAFPDGIPQNTPMGIFLGKQVQAFF